MLTISPLDHVPIVESVKKTGRAVIIHKAPRSFGPGAEINSRLMEKAFYYLEAPIARVTGYDMVIPPFSKKTFYLPNAQRITRAARSVLGAEGGEAMAKAFKLPNLGEGIHEGEILSIRVSVGEGVKEGDIILEVETDKAAVEIPSPYTGVVEEIL